MNFYETKISFKKLNTRKSEEEQEERNLFPDENGKRRNNIFRDIIFEANQGLGFECDSKNSMSVYIWNAAFGRADIIYAIDMDISDRRDAEKFIQKYFEKNYDISDFKIEDTTEITTEQFYKLGCRGDNNGFIRRFHSESQEMNINFRDNHAYRFREYIIPSKKLSLSSAKKKAKSFIADKTVYDELERIYSPENSKKYYGNPVHYKITASNFDSAMNMVNLLTESLKANNRLNGSRISRIYDIEEYCHNEDDIRNILEVSSGNVVLIDMSGSSSNHGNYASAYEDVVEFFHKLISNTQLKTLFIFFENSSHPGFSDSLLSAVSGEIDIIEMKEGSGSREDVIDFILHYSKENNYEVEKKEVVEMLPDKKTFTVSEAYELFNKHLKNGLKNKIYKSYKYCSVLEMKNEKRKSEPYDTLKNMVGLTAIKEVVDEIIDSARIQKMRSEMGMDSYKTSLHMVFTGNPGSAKTTVARLISEILTKEGILATGKYVECGRSDLVGRYVGWTAKAVVNKFRMAEGGVLFIDEAYSLVDDSNSFGDEAINTIVQEMENHRDDVIVIFAGYPEKMKAFLDKNEGLRSRIAFHLDFPDYNSDELSEILKLMAKDKGYKLEDDVEKKCRNYFDLAVLQSDFGNGRFVRNLLEQAMMSQAKRIANEYKGKKVNRKALSTLKAEDFNVNLGERLKKEEKRKIGFAV